MRPHLLFVGEESSAPPVLADVAESLGAFHLHRRSQIDEVMADLQEYPPRILFIEIERVGPAALELLSSVEALQLRIPVLVLASRAPGVAPPLGLSPFLATVSKELPRERLRAAVLGQLERAAMAGRQPMFRVADYLQLAVLFSLSVSLRLRCKKGDQEQVDVVDGDIWNVYAGATEGETALASILFDSPEWIGTAPLRTLPGHRHCPGSGTETLRRAAAGLLGAPAAQRRLRLVAAAHPRPQAVRGGVGAVGGARFEGLFDAGLRAALARDYERARDSFEAALTLRPDEPRVLYNLKRVRRRLL